MINFRIPQTALAYREAIHRGLLQGSCVLCSKPSLEAFIHWKILPNDYPYDEIAEVHHMIVPVRHVTEQNLTSEEREELEKIREEYIHPNYDYILEGTQKTKTVPAHYHLHLIVIKKDS